MRGLGSRSRRPSGAISTIIGSSSLLMYQGQNPRQPRPMIHPDRPHRHRACPHLLVGPNQSECQIPKGRRSACSRQPGAQPARHQPDLCQQRCSTGSEPNPGSLRRAAGPRVCGAHPLLLGRELVWWRVSGEGCNCGDKATEHCVLPGVEPARPGP